MFEGVDQAGPSFEARVYLNHPGADETTPRTPEAGYAGSFHVYAYGTPAPPAIAERKTRQAARGHEPIAPIEKRLHADERALRTALERSDELIISVVPVPVDPGGPVPERPFTNVHVVFDRGATD